MLWALLLAAAACSASAFTASPALGLRSGAGALAQSKARRATASPTMEVTLYGSRSSRSPLVEWLLVETGTKYTHREDREGLPNPFGQIPALLDDGGVEIFESGAILLYIADKYGPASQTAEDRAKYTKWVVWANSALDKALFTPNIERAAPPYLAVLDEQLKGKEYLCGEFSAADVAVASYLGFIPMFHPNFSVARFPNVVNYMERCVMREGYQKAFSTNGPRAAAYVKAQKGQVGGGEKKAFGLF